MKVVTITLNPAFDVHAKSDRFIEYNETIAEIISTESGGKGVNVSRALSENGIDNNAIIIVGKENGSSFLDFLKDFNMNITPIFVDGRIRENITIHDKDNKETRLSFTGFKVNNDIINDVEKAIGEVNNDTIITFTGSNPKGLDIDTVKSLIYKLKDKGAKIVIDSRSFSLNDLLEIKPWLIKPNYPEINEYYKKEFSLDEIKEKALELNKHCIENVIISLGGDGSFYAHNNKVYLCRVPKINVISTIGAGDSTIGGFIYGTINGYKNEELIRIASSFGSAACLRDGTLPPLKKDIENIYNKTYIE